MPPIIALLLFVSLVVILLRIERGRAPDVPVMLWVPTIWLLLCASKPIARWVTTNPTEAIGEAGSPIDRLVLSIFIILAVLILFSRRVDWSRILRDNFWLILLFLYLGLTILWSDFPFVSFKRWIRLSAMIPIAMIILTAPNPLKSLESVFRRCAYILVPISLLLIKYFPDLGVSYVSWSGMKSWVGVASQKNGLGLISTLSAFFIFWSFYQQWRVGTLMRNRWHALADGLVLTIALHLLRGYEGVYSATATAILILGIVTLIFLFRSKENVRPKAMILLTGLVVTLLCLQFYDPIRSSITSVFDRDSTFTERTDIWDIVLEIASRNPWFGRGYGSFYGLDDYELYSEVGVRSAHSGYLDVYLEGGIVGVVILVAFLLAFYLKVLREVKYAYEWGLFGICILLMMLVENFTESVFIQTSSYFWNMMVFLSVTFSEPLFRQSAKIQSNDLNLNDSSKSVNAIGGY